MVGYVGGWNVYGGRKLSIASIPGDKFTHLNYAFANVSTGGVCIEDNPSGDHASFAELQKLKKQFPSLKTLISIGGADGSRNFPRAAQSASSRKQFAESCVRFMTEFGFDGIDIDWEFPDNTDQKQNYAAMLAELRAQLDALGKSNNTHYLLAIAAPAGPDDYADVPWNKIAGSLDWINLMTYDFAGSWSDRTGFNAPLYPASGSNAKLYNGNAAVQAYLTAGVPSNKLVLGVPFYGRGWKGVPNVNRGFNQKFDGVPKGDGSIDYRTIQTTYRNYPRYWDDQAKVPWLYDPSSGIMISYDDAESLVIKTDYARAQKLGGMMIWELSQDDDQHTLLNAMAGRLK
jgi:chitinase